MHQWELSVKIQPWQLSGEKVAHSSATVCNPSQIKPSPGEGARLVGGGMGNVIAFMGSRWVAALAPVVQRVRCYTRFQLLSGTLSRAAAVSSWPSSGEAIAAAGE